MRHSQAFFVGLIFAASTVASAVGSLTPNLISAPKVSEFCSPLICKNSVKFPSIVIPERPPVLVCYCGSESPILIQIITDLNQISPLDSEKRLIKLNSNSTISGTPARYILTENVDLANRLANNNFSYTILSEKRSMDIKLSNFVSPLNGR